MPYCVFHFRYAGFSSPPLPFFRIQLHFLPCACLSDFCCRLSTHFVPVCAPVPFPPISFQTNPPRHVCRLLCGQDCNDVWSVVLLLDHSPCTVQDLARPRTRSCARLCSSSPLHPSKRPCLLALLFRPTWWRWYDDDLDVDLDDVVVDDDRDNDNDGMKMMITWRRT